MSLRFHELIGAPSQDCSTEIRLPPQSERLPRFCRSYRFSIHRGVLPSFARSTVCLSRSLTAQGVRCASHGCLACPSTGRSAGYSRGLAAQHATPDCGWESAAPLRGRVGRQTCVHHPSVHQRAGVPKPPACRAYATSDISDMP
jgi:hypothetical protein